MVLYGDHFHLLLEVADKEHSVEGYANARRGFSREEVEQAWKDGGKLPLHAALRCRVRYFTDGVALGGRRFLDNYFESRPEMFGPSRKTGARKMRGAQWDGLMSIRDLSVDAITPA